jgi:hypothetical protein
VGVQVLTVSAAKVAIFTWEFDVHSRASAAGGRHENIRHTPLQLARAGQAEGILQSGLNGPEPGAGSGYEDVRYKKANDEALLLRRSPEKSVREELRQRSTATRVTSRWLPKGTTHSGVVVRALKLLAVLVAVWPAVEVEADVAVDVAPSAVGEVDIE